VALSCLAKSLLVLDFSFLCLILYRITFATRLTALVDIVSDYFGIHLSAICWLVCRVLTMLVHLWLAVRSDSASLVVIIQRAIFSYYC